MGGPAPPARRNLIHSPGDTVAVDHVSVTGNAIIRTMETTVSDAAPKPLLGIIPRDASRYSWLALTNTWITWALNVMVFNMLYTLGANIIEEFDLSPIAWGWIIIGYLVVRVLCDFPITLLSDRLGHGWRRKYVWSVVMAEYAIVGALIAIPALSGSVAGFLLLLAGIALGTTASEAIGVVASVEWWPKKYSGFAVGLHHTGFPIGALLGGWFAAWVISATGPEEWRIAYLASLFTIPFILWYWAISTPKNYDKMVEKSRRQGLRGVWDDAREEKITFRSALAALKQREIIIAIVCIFAFQGMYNVFATTYPAYLRFVGGYSFEQVASLSVVWAITGAVFQFLLPALSDRLGRKWFIVGAGILQAVVFLALPAMTSLLGVVLVQLVYGVTVNAVFPLLLSTVSDVAGKKLGSLIGLTFTAMWFGGIVGTFLATFVLQEGGGFSSPGAYRAVYGIIVVIALLTAALRLFGRETNPFGKSAEIADEAMPVKG